MLAFRYLAKEVLLTLTACMLIVVFILISNQLAVFYSRSLNGSSQIPGILIIKFLILEMPLYMSFLFPLGFYISILIVYGRLFNENEMLVLQTCGLTSLRLYQYTFAIGVLTSLLVAWMLYLNPIAIEKKHKIFQNLGVKGAILMLNSQEFQTFPDNRVVFIEKINREHTDISGFFSASYSTNPSNPWKWEIISAKNIKMHAANALKIGGGQIYRINFDSGYSQLGVFNEAELKLPSSTPQRRIDYREWTFSQLWKNRKGDHKAHVEIEWRISLIFVPIFLTLIVVPLSITKPREDRYLKIFPAILLYTSYSFLLCKFYDNQLWSDKPFNSDFIVMTHFGVFVLAICMFWYQKRRLIL